MAATWILEGIVDDLVSEKVVCLERMAFKSKLRDQRRCKRMVSASIDEGWVNLKRMNCRND